MDCLAFFVGHMLDDIDELTETQITHFATPDALHAVDVQIFKKQHIIFVGQFVGSLKLPVPSLIGNLFVRLGQLVFGLFAIARPILLARQRTILGSNVIERLLEELWCDDVIFLFASREESFQPKSKPAV